jgi:RHS repeat-associated protein
MTRRSLLLDLFARTGRRKCARGRRPAAVAALRSAVAPVAAEYLEQRLMFADITISVQSVAGADEGSPGTPGRFVFYSTSCGVRSLPSSVTVSFALSGSATSGTDYTGALTLGTVVVPVGTSAPPVEVEFTAVNDAAVEGHEEVVVTLQGGSDYDVVPFYAVAAAGITDSDGGGTVTPPPNPGTPPPDTGTNSENCDDCPPPTDGSGGRNGPNGSGGPRGAGAGPGNRVGGPPVMSPGGGGGAGGWNNGPRYAGRAAGLGTVSEAPVRYGDGLVQEETADLPSSSSVPWGHVRSWTNNDGYARSAQNGNGWTVEQWPGLVPSASGNAVAHVIDGNDAQWFDGTTSFTARHGSHDKLALVGGEYVLTLADGSQYRFYDFDPALPAAQRGAFKSYRDPAGNAVVAQPYDGNGNLTEVRMGAAGTAAMTSYAYEYYASGANAGRLQRASYQVSEDGGANWTVVRKAEYDYYDGSGTGENAFGRVGDLRTAVVKTGGGDVLDTTYYRYYTATGGTGYAGGMRMVLYGEDYARAVTGLGNPLTASDNSLKPFASRYYEYDAQKRVSLETVSAAGCSTCSGGMGTYGFEYTTSQTNPVGYNSWKYKTVETLPDGNQNILYMNYLQQVMLRVFKDVASSQEWAEYTQYDSAGRAKLVAQPSAVSQYWHASADLMTDPGAAADAELEGLRDNQGVITFREYGTANSGGDAVGYLKRTSLMNGELAVPVTQEELSYVARTAGSVTTYVIAGETVFRNDNGTGGQTTSHVYTWRPGTSQVESITTTLPTVTTGQNGPGSATTLVTFFDEYGRAVWSKDGDGFITGVEYDPSTGAVVRVVRDVQTTWTPDAPAGWVTPVGGGLHLTTEYQVDDLGRITRVADPKENALAGTGSVTYYVYNDAAHEVRTYRGWTQAGGNWGPTGPVLVSRDDRAGNYNETLTFAYTPGASATPGGAEAITVANIQSLVRKFDNQAGQLDHTDRYFSLAGQSSTNAAEIGSLGQQFLRTEYEYQGRGLLKRVQSSDGTIRWTVYDGLNRVVSRWTGTNDTGATNADPTGGGASGNNMVKTAQYAYDAGGIGDGNLTQSRIVFGSGANDYYATDMKYDWRDRPTDVRGPDKVATRYTLDNLGRTTQTDTYADADADFVIDAGELRGRTQAAFDEQGRVYQSKVFNVDPVTGSVTAGSGQTGHVLTTNTWYNRRGMAVKVAQPNGLFLKTKFDGAGRPVASYVAYDTTDTEGGTAYDGAQTTTGDTVIEQVKTIYDQADNVVTTTSYERLESDTTSTGDLGAATNQAFVQVRVNWYDRAGRAAGTANYGRDNGATRYVFNTSGALIDANVDGLPDEAENAPRLPNTSDDYIAARYEYDDSGRMFRTTDNRGRIDQSFHDLLGRRTKLVENVGGTNAAQVETDTHQRRTTEWVYDAAGRLSKQVAWNPKGQNGAGDAYDNIEKQATTYLYESPFDGSWATSTIYPDSADTTSAGTDQDKCAYDRLGRKVSCTDQRGTVHTYEYDAAGRFYADNVATPGVGVDAAVRRIERTYDSLSRVESVTSRSGSTAASAVVNQVKTTYDGWGNVVKSQQAHAGAVTGTTAAVQYAYDDGLPSGSTNTAALFVRQSKVTYPATNRVVFYNYGASNVAGTQANSWYLNRIDNVADSAAGTNKYAQYTYLGAGRIVRVSHPAVGPNNITLSYSLGSAGQYQGFDRFGRVVQQFWKDGALSGGNFDGYQYTYDRGGNLKSKDYIASGNAGQFDEAYQYDGLDRLVEARRGTLDANKRILAPKKLWDWSLDSQGNWRTYRQIDNPQAGDVNLDGSVDFSDYQRWELGGSNGEANRWSDGDLNGDGSVDISDFTIFNANNGATGGPAAPAHARTTNAANELTDVSQTGWVDPTYDAAGNSTSGPKAGAEGTRLHYVYDAWNRLVQVKNDNGSGSPGTTLATYAYDGLNRRVSKATGGNTDVSYYNEGWQLLEVRRNGSANAREQYTWDAGYIDTPIFRALDANSDGDTADAGDNTLYYLTDANHNVTSIYQPSTNRIEERYVYDPYGRVTIYDRAWGSVRAASTFENAVQYGGYVYDAETGNSYARNRYYQPTLGRWISRDPIGRIAERRSMTESHAPAMVGSEISGLRSSGDADLISQAIDRVSAKAQARFGAESKDNWHLWQYAEGSNLYEFLTSNPLGATDPLGTDRYITSCGGHQGIAVDTWTLVGGKWVATGIAQYDFSVNWKHPLLPCGLLVGPGLVSGPFPGFSCPVSKTIRSDQKADSELKARLDKLKQNPPLYSAALNNCRHFAQGNCGVGLPPDWEGIGGGLQ